MQDRIKEKTLFGGDWPLKASSFYACFLNRLFCNLTMTAAIPSGRSLFCCAGHGICTAVLPPVFNQDRRFSLRQPLLFVAKATNNCLIRCRSGRRQGCPLLCSAVHSVLPAKQPPAFNQDGRFSLFNREKKSAEKRENLDTAKAETPSDAYGAESGVSFCLPEQPASSHSAERSALR